MSIPTKERQANGRSHDEREAPIPDVATRYVSDLPKVLAEEHRTIRDRRKRFLFPRHDPEKDNWTGLSLSGGGVRSACFNLGLLEAIDEQAVRPQPADGAPPAGSNGGIGPPGVREADKCRYLELFDYVSTVSGGSYVAGHLATAMIPADEEGARFGDVAFTTNSVPRWFWALGVWFLGFVFQLLKTGSALVLVLGTVALELRTCDAPDVMRFCNVLGLRSDVARGFVPFWVTLGIILVAYALHFRNGPAGWWLSACAVILLAYNAIVWWFHSSSIPLSYSVHIGFIIPSVVLALAFLMVKRARRPGRTRGAEEGSATESWMRWIFLLPMLAALVCLAGLVTTGDISWGPSAGGPRVAPGRATSQGLTELGQGVYQAAIAALGLTSLTFLRWRALLTSTRKVADRLSDARWGPVYQVIVFLCSYGFLLLLIFVLYGMMARENVSDYEQRREADPAAAFHRTDFQPWDRAWERIAIDSKHRGAKKDSPWKELAASLLEVRRARGLGLVDEKLLTEAIQRLEAMPWTVRLAYGASLYNLKTTLAKLQDDVAGRIGEQVLARPDLYLDLPDNIDEAPWPRLGDMKTSKEDLEPLQLEYREQWSEYVRQAGHLEELARSPLQVSIRQNNRRALRLYLGDLVRDRERHEVIFASVVWAEDQWTRLRIIAFAGAIWILCCLLNVNTFSLQAFYRDHVRDQWMRARRGVSGAGWLFEDAGVYRGRVSGSSRTGEDSGRWSIARSGPRRRRAPLLLINATVQGNRAIGVDPELTSDIFTFSPVAAGSRKTGYWLSGTRGQKPDNEFVRRNRLDISQMVAISGAFLSPGQVANPALAAILHLLNIQTGWWARDPEKSKQESLGNHLLFHFFHSLGIDREGDSRFLLTDGAHVENLGLKVLLNRRCALIVASDCSQEDEAGHRFGALIEVLRQAQIDGIEIGPFLSAKAYRHWLVTGRIEKVRGKPADCRHVKSWGLDLIVPPDADKETPPSKASPPAAGPADGETAPVTPPNATAETSARVADGSGKPKSPAGRGAVAAEVPLAQEHFLFAHIRYPGPDRTEGLLVYLRPTLTGDEGESLLRRTCGSSFPDDPPLDQFYTAARMNRYRLLGRHIGRELVANREVAEALRLINRGLPVIARRSRRASRDAGDACVDCRVAGVCVAHVERAYRPQPPGRSPAAASDRRIRRCNVPRGTPDLD